MGENANARVPQSDLTAEQKTEAQHHLDNHKKAAGIGEFAETVREPFKHELKEQVEIEFEISPEPTMDELIQSIEDVVESINEALDTLRTRIEALEKQKEPAKVTPITETPKESLDEAIIEPGALSNPTPSDVITKQEILALLPTETPPQWGYGPQELIRKLRKKLEGGPDII